jgi:hypothetical protein
VTRKLSVSLCVLRAYTIGVSYTINSGPDDLGLFDGLLLSL